MRGVVEQKEFFQRDNYLMLASIRRSLVSYVEDLHKPVTSLKAGLKIHSRKMFSHHAHSTYTNGGSERDIIAILESALLSLGRCIDLARPAGLLVSSVSKNDWTKALHALEHALQELSYCDPDQQLHPSEWGKLIDNETDMLNIEWVRPSYYQDEEKRLEHEKKIRLELKNEIEENNIPPPLGSRNSLFPIDGEDDISLDALDEALLDDGM
uniref:Uncharacterized protein n=1 Tax=Eucampia antarctica TaxID=49252 RepID=A0A7S2R1L4_9STRA